MRVKRVKPEDRSRGYDEGLLICQMATKIPGKVSKRNETIHKTVTFKILNFFRNVSPRNLLKEPVYISFYVFFVLCLSDWFIDLLGSVDFIHPKMKAPLLFLVTYALTVSPSSRLVRCFLTYTSIVASF